MKRSEMIDFIVINSSQVGLNLNPFEARDIIGKVLALSEKAGMLPPLYLNSDSHEDHCLSYEEAECDCGGVSENEWEPEE